MSDQLEEKTMGLAAMPGILVIITLGYLFVMHVGYLVGERERTGEGFEADYLEASAQYLREPVNQARAKLGLMASDVVQRDGELYYLPDIEHLSARNFMIPAQRKGHVVLRREEKSRRVREETPLPAILDFDRKLRARGIRLVLLPTPSKAMLAGPGKETIRNAGFHSLLDELRKKEVAIFDLAPHFAEYRRRGNAPFLRTDSHWTPETMRLSAVLLAAFLEREQLLPEGSAEAYEGGTERITNSGDLAMLMEGGPSANWQETIAIHPVKMSDGARWLPNRESPLLLLGDSFTNVFSLGDLGWGEEAGLAEALSQTLGYGVDRLARNAEGASASRAGLQRESGRLDGKKVVVWQFAARELSFGDWKVLPLPTSGADLVEPAVGARSIELEGTIASVAPVPSLTRAPYRRAVMEVLLRDVRSDGVELPEEIVLLGLGVEDRVPTAMTKWKVRRKVKLKVVGWREVEADYGRLRRFALEDPELELIDAVRLWILK